MGQFIHNSPILYGCVELLIALLILMSILLVAFGSTVGLMWLTTQPWRPWRDGRRARRAAEQAQCDDYPARERIDQPYHDGCQCLTVCQRIRHGHHSK